MNRIAIGIPTYRRELTLIKLLDSIPAGFLVSVSDNGCFVRSEVRDRFPEVSFNNVPEVLPMFANWNNAIQTVRECDYVIMPSDDDLFYENSYSAIVKAIDDYPMADILIFGVNIIDENGNTTSTYLPSAEKYYTPPYGFKEFEFGVSARMPGIVFRKSFLDRIGVLDSSFELTAADSDLIQRALLLGCSVFVPVVVAAYRVWDGGLTSNKIASKTWMDEIDRWTGKISELAISCQKDIGLRFSPSRFRDTVFAHNLLVGLVLLYRRNQYIECLEHFRICRFPKKAKIVFKLKIVFIVFLAQLQLCFRKS